MSFFITYTRKVHRIKPPVGNYIVHSVPDGDGLLINYMEHQIELRLKGIDAPEMGQPYGLQARQCLQRMVTYAHVKVVPYGFCKYGRTTAFVYIGGICLNEEMVRRGFAWVLGEYLTKEQRILYTRMMNKAKAANLGLWAGTDIVHPSIWRKNYPYKG